MNLTKLFKMQKQLDEHILNEHPELRNQDNLPWKILALQVELGECANEWRGFKKWSKDQEPRIWYPNERDICESCKGEPIFFENGKIVGQCNECDGCGVHFHNPLLEEYVDGLHFILSIGLDLDYKYSPVPGIYPIDITNLFIEMNYKTSELHLETSHFGLNGGDVHNIYQDIFDCFLVLGKSLGFTWEQIEQAYLDKNKINHARQESGY